MWSGEQVSALYKPWRLILEVKSSHHICERSWRTGSSVTTACLKLRIAHSLFCVYALIIFFFQHRFLCVLNSRWWFAAAWVCEQTQLFTSKSLTHTHSWLDDWLPLWLSLIVKTSLFYNCECSSCASVLHRWVFREHSCSVGLEISSWRSSCQSDKH